MLKYLMHKFALTEQGAKDFIKTERHLDETEDIEVIELPKDEVKKMLDNGDIKTSSEAIGLLHYFMYQNK